MATAPNRTQIDGAGASLSPTSQAVWLSLIRQNARYRSAVLGFQNLENALAAVDGLKAKQLNAALDLIEAVGVGEIGIKGGDDAVDYSQARERDALIDYGLSVLYDQPIGAFLSGRRVASSTVRSPTVLS